MPFTVICTKNKITYCKVDSQFANFQLSNCVYNNEFVISDSKNPHMDTFINKYILIKVDGWFDSCQTVNFCPKMSQSPQK